MGVIEKQKQFREFRERARKMPKYFPGLKKGMTVNTVFGIGKIVCPYCQAGKFRLPYPIVQFDFYPEYPGGQLSFKDAVLLYPYDWYPVEVRQ